MSAKLTGLLSHMGLGTEPREGQAECMALLVKRKQHLFVSLPPGGGKTMICVLHALLLQRDRIGQFVLLVTPVASSAQQVAQKAIKSGVPAVSTTSIGRRKDRRWFDAASVIRAEMETPGTVRLVSTTPEKLARDLSFRATIEHAVSQGIVAAIYVDEPDLLLKEFRGPASRTTLDFVQRLAPRCPLCLCSGTLTPSSVQALKECLLLPFDVVHITGNMAVAIAKVRWQVIRKEKAKGREANPRSRMGDPLHPCFMQIGRLAQDYTRSGKVIIFASTYVECSTIHKTLLNCGISSIECHSGTNSDGHAVDGDAVCQAFSDPAGPSVMVSTNAKNERAMDYHPAKVVCVIETGGMASLDTLIQHGMRNSRCRQYEADNELDTADHIFLYDYDDAVAQLRHCKKEHEHVNHVVLYCELAVSCRVSFLLQYLGLRLPSSDCVSSCGSDSARLCDTCQAAASCHSTGAARVRTDMTAAANLVVDLVSTSGAKMSVKMLTNVLLGDKTQLPDRLQRDGCRSSAFGILKDTKLPSRFAHSSACELVCVLLASGCLKYNFVNSPIIGRKTCAYVHPGPNSGCLLTSDINPFVTTLDTSVVRKKQMTKQRLRDKKLSAGLVDVECLQSSAADLGGPTSPWVTLAKQTTELQRGEHALKNDAFMTSQPQRILVAQCMQKLGYICVSVPRTKWLDDTSFVVCAGVVIALAHETGVDWLHEQTMPHLKKEVEKLKSSVRRLLSLHKTESLDRLICAVNPEAARMIAHMEETIASLLATAELLHKDGIVARLNDTRVQVNEAVADLCLFREKAWVGSLPLFGQTHATLQLEAELLTWLLHRPIEMYSENGTHSTMNIGGLPLLRQADDKPPIQIVAFECGRTRALTHIQTTHSGGVGFVKAASNVPDPMPERVAVFDAWNGTSSMRGSGVGVVVSTNTFLRLSRRCASLELPPEQARHFREQRQPQPCLLLSQVPDGRWVVDEHAGRHRALFVKGEGFMYMTIRLVVKDGVTKLPPTFAGEDNKVCRDGILSDISETGNWARTKSMSVLTNDVASTTQLLHLIGEGMPQGTLYIGEVVTSTLDHPTTPVPADVQAKATIHHVAKDDRAQKMLQVFHSPGRTPVGHNLRATENDGARPCVVVINAEEHLVTSRAVAITVVERAYAAQLLQVVRPSMLLSHEGDPNWHVLMRHTYHMRTVIGGEAIRELSTPSQCPPASCVADCCVGRCKKPGSALVVIVCRLPSI